MMSIPVFPGERAPAKKEDQMLIPSLLLSLAAAPEAAPQAPIFSCEITEHTLEAKNHSMGTLVVSFASSDRSAVLHLAVPAKGTLAFRFPARSISEHWMEITSLSRGQLQSTGALALQSPGHVFVYAQSGQLESAEASGTLLPPSIASHVSLPSCARALDVGVPPPSEDPVVDEVTDLRRRIRRPI